MSASISSDKLHHIRETHEELHETIDDLQQILRQHSTPAVAVSANLIRLATQLEEHFGQEDAYGMFEDILEVSPQFADEVQRVRDEHTALLNRIRKLSADAGSRRENSRHWLQMQIQFGEFVTALRRNEEAENELLLRAFRRSQQ